MGNLIERNNHKVGLTETYGYDALMRVDYATHGPLNNENKTVDYDYDIAGNIKKKDDYASNYIYGNSSRNGDGNAGPNAVRRVTKSSGNVYFNYDDNGNMTSGDGVSINYNDDNKATQIIRNGITSHFKYGADGMRFRQVNTVGSTTNTTYYLGKSMERVKRQTGANVTIFDKTFVGGHTILFTPVQGTLPSESTIVHTLQDRLGGVDTLVDGSQHIDDVGFQEDLVQQRRAYDIFGRPRHVDDGALLDFRTSLNSNLQTDWQEIKQGFTGHEHLPESELIHMNGRIFDYNIGRFLGVDPFIQMPTNSQSANPYTYIFNNPMSGTDPTGYVGETDKEDATKAPAETKKKEEKVVKGQDCRGSANKMCSSTGEGSVNVITVTNGDGKTTRTRILSKVGKQSTNVEKGDHGAGQDGLPGHPNIRFFVAPEGDNISSKNIRVAEDISLTDDEVLLLNNEIFELTRNKQLELATAINEKDLSTVSKITGIHIGTLKMSMDDATIMLLTLGHARSKAGLGKVHQNMKIGAKEIGELLIRPTGKTNIFKKLVKGILGEDPRISNFNVYANDKGNWQYSYDFYDKKITRNF